MRAHHDLTLALIGIAGNVTGILLYASPLPIFVRIVRQRSTEAFSGVTYAFSFLSTAQWTYFAFLRGPRARPLASLTIIGFSFQAAFNCIYLRFASKSQRVLQLILLATAASFYACMVTLTSLLLKSNTRANVVGLICTVNSVFYSASPLIILRRVIKSGSTEFLPFFLPLCLFLSGVIWSIFAFLTRDLFIAIPNGVNIMLGALQLSIHFYYKMKGLCHSKSPFVQNCAKVGGDVYCRSNGAECISEKTKEHDSDVEKTASLDATGASLSSSWPPADHEVKVATNELISRIVCTTLC
ncbi:hypothetical protein L7F22_032260 [Adiantum nelumboides]|nr:hypothetical protein [Adiantum nelumboides]